MAPATAQSSPAGRICFCSFEYPPYFGGVSRSERIVDHLLDEGFEVHGFFLPMADPLLAMARRGRRPVLASIRGNDAVSWIEKPARRRVVERVCREASWITSVSSDLLENSLSTERCWSVGSRLGR